MTTQSKSVLMPFLIIAGIVFAVALAWKFLGNHDTKSTVKASDTNMSAPVKTIKPKTVQPARNFPKPAKTVESQPAFLEPIVEDKEVLRKRAKSHMKFAMRYKTIEQGITALQQFRENGNDPMAEDLIKFIETSFPNENIPVDLLD